MKFLWPLLLIFSFSNTALADPPKAYFQPGSVFSPEKLVVDGKVMNVGLFGARSFPQAVESNPLAKKFAEDHLVNQTAATISGVVLGIAPLGYMLYELTSGDGINSSNFWTAYYISLGGLLATGILTRYAQMRMIQSMNAYNGVASQQSQIKIYPTFNGLGMVYTF